MTRSDWKVTFLEDEDLFVVPGWRGVSLATGVKPSGNPDLALLVAQEPMNCAGLFTKNACAAAPVVLCRAQLQQHKQIKSIVVNSGNANALTGPQGDIDAKDMVSLLEQRCGGPGLVLSTGIIGTPLPREAVLSGITEASELLTRTKQKVAEAILTTDTTKKIAAARIEYGEGKSWHVGGLAKGSGMIHPNMATMLAVVATDVPVSSELLEQLLGQSVDESFHQISVDGDTSTNDSVLLLAPPPTREAIPADLHLALAEALKQVFGSLAQQIVDDGEGASRWMNLRVIGAQEAEDAKRIADSIVRSPLVKTALAGGSTNWGRILSAAGNADVALDLTKLSLFLGPHKVFGEGRPLVCDQASLEATSQARRLEVRLDLGVGQANAYKTTVDLTHKYVEINADYLT